jgi:hypothetical protein
MVILFYVGYLYINISLVSKASMAAMVSIAA